MLLPLSTEYLAGGQSNCYFETDWFRGPHLTLALRDGSYTSNDLSRIFERMKELVASVPESQIIEPHEYRLIHERLKRYEGRSGDAFPWIRDGTVRMIRDNDRVRRIGLAAAEVIDAFQCGVYLLELQLLASMDQFRGGADGYALGVMTKCAAKFSKSGILAAAPSYMSHAHGYMGLAGNESLRAVWENNFQRMRDALIGYVQQCEESALRDSDYEAPDVAILGPLNQAFEDENSFKAFVPEEGWVDRIRTRSEFHRRLAGNDRWVSLVAEDEWFARYRMVVNLMYLHLTKMGLTPHRRFYTCYLIARAAEELHGVDSLTYLEGE